MNLHPYSCLHYTYKLPQCHILILFFKISDIEIAKNLFNFSVHTQTQTSVCQDAQFWSPLPHSRRLSFHCWMEKTLHWLNKSKPFACAALLFIVFCALRFIFHNQPCSRRSGKEHWFIPEKQPTMAFCTWWSFAHSGGATPEWISHIFCNAFVCAGFDGLTRHLNHLQAQVYVYLWESYWNCTNVNQVLLQTQSLA